MSIGASLVAQMVKNRPIKWETRVLSLGLEVPLEKKMSTHSNILAWRAPWTEEPGRLQSMGLQRVRHDWVTSLTLNMSIESVMSFNHLILCCSLLLLPSVFPSIRVFSNELALCITWPKYWSFSFSISHSNDYPGLISFRIDQFELLAVQGTLSHLLQHHNLKASLLQCSAFFMVQISHPYMMW